MKTNNDPDNGLQNGQEDQNTPQEYGRINIFYYRGRIGRVRYFAYSSLLFLVLFVVFSLLEPYGSFPVVIAVAVPFVLFVLLTIQRLHDANHNGWWFLLVLIPYINLLVCLSFVLIHGTNGSNKFGHQPPPNTWGVITVAWLLLPLLIVLGILISVASK